MIDGGSSDGTPAVAASWADKGVRVIESTPGRGRQLEAGARASYGDALIFLHADTWMDPQAGAALARALARPVIVGGCFKLALRGPSTHRLVSRLLTSAINARTRAFRTATGDQAIFCRRDAYERLGGFTDDDLFEDVIFYRRLRRLGGLAFLEPPVRTSDRRWRVNGYLRTIATHLAFRLLFLLGVSPERLARLYRDPGELNRRNY